MTEPNATSEPPLPHNLDAEKAVIGAVLGSSDALKIVCEGLKPDDFYRPAYKTIAKVLIDAWLEGWPADVVTVGDQLEREGTPVDRDILTDAVIGCPFGSAVSRYVAIVKDRSLRRELINAADDIANAARSCLTAKEGLDQAEKILADVRADSTRRPQ